MICTHTYIYIHTHVYTYIRVHIHAHTHGSSELSSYEIDNEIDYDDAESAGVDAKRQAAKEAFLAAARAGE